MSVRTRLAGQALANLAHIDPDGVALIRRELADLREEAANWRRKYRRLQRETGTTSSQQNHTPEATQ